MGSSATRTAAAAVVALAAVGCGNGGTDEANGASSPPAEAAAETTVAVEMGNFFVRADPASVPAGTVTFDVDIETAPGARIHALTVLRTDLPPDGLPISEELQADTVDDRIEVVYSEAGTSEGHSVEIELRSGSYLLICNVADHYSLGMRTGFEVT